MGDDYDVPVPAFRRDYYYGSSYVQPRTYHRNRNNFERRPLNIHIRGSSAFGGGDGGKKSLKKQVTRLSE